MNEKRDIAKGLFAGAIGGLAASIVMNKVQQFLGKFLTGEERSHGAQSLQPGAPHRGAGRMLEERGVENPDDDSAERLAQTISVGAFDRTLSEGEKDALGTAFHYGYGISMGAAYGAAAEFVPATTLGTGMPYGALIWIGADEVVIPALGLSKRGDEYPPSILAAALLAHMAYGFTTEVVRRAIRNAI